MSARRLNRNTAKPGAAKRNRRLTVKRPAAHAARHTTATRTRLEVTVRPPPPPLVPNPDALNRDDPSLDRRIIEGMLTDRKILLDELAREGIRAAQVIRRAADLGLSEAYIRQVQGVAADLAGERPGARRSPVTLGARTCLCCDRVFLSSGPGNRLCMRCRGGDAGLAQL